MKIIHLLLLCIWIPNAYASSDLFPQEPFKHSVEIDVDCVELKIKIKLKEIDYTKYCLRKLSIVTDTIDRTYVIAGLRGTGVVIFSGIDSSESPSGQEIHLKVDTLGAGIKGGRPVEEKVVGTCSSADVNPDEGKITCSVSGKDLSVNFD